MNAHEKIMELRDVINKELASLITGDYVLWDIPYYYNIGDTLIWEGTRMFLKQFPYKCINATDIRNYTPMSLSQNTIILLQGGGNWGDLYREHDDLRKRIVQMYPHNKIVIFPQTVFYETEDTLREDMNFYKTYSNVTICARDEVSYQILKQHLPNNNILLVPDMAFFIDVDEYKRSEKQEGKVLYLKRKDKELSTVDVLIPSSADIRDWPLFEKIPFKYDIINTVFGICKRLFPNTQLARNLINFKWNKIFRLWNIKCGIDFLNNYDTIYSTRLHVIILSILLHKKEIYLIDNLSSKNLNFYNTWLRDLDNITLCQHL